MICNVEVLVIINIYYKYLYCVGCNFVIGNYAVRLSPLIVNDFKYQSAYCSV